MQDSVGGFDRKRWLAQLAPLLRTWEAMLAYAPPALQPAGARERPARISGSHAIQAPAKGAVRAV